MSSIDSIEPTPPAARDSGGLGLGLTITKAIVDAHGGTLLVQSAPGKGCTFAVRLPRGSQTA